MRLLYAWISKYRNIKEECRISFAHDHTINFDQKSKYLNIGKLDTYGVDNFFGDNISSLSALIGKNSTGKSNIIELICTVFYTGKRNLLEEMITKNHTEVKIQPMVITKIKDLIKVKETIIKQAK